MTRRVVVTGLGAVSAAGIGTGALLEALCAPRSGVARIAAFDPAGFACQAGGEVRDFSARDFVPKSYRKAVKLMARDIELAVAAADLAFRDAALPTPGTEANGASGGSHGARPDGARVGCNIGAGLLSADLQELGAAMRTALNDRGELDLARWGREGMANLTPLWLLKYLPNMLACHVTIIHDLRGPSNTITCGEPSGLMSIAEAAWQILRGDADAAIAGGAESKLNPMGLLRQSKLGRLVGWTDGDPSASCRPFDADHAGTVVGEGAALLVLEEAAHAARRGARVHAELVGSACSVDPAGVDPLARHCGNVGLACRRALAEAGIGPGELDLVIAHGTGVPHEDDLEAADLRELLDGADVPVVSLTGAIGNTHAADGALAAAVAAGAIDRQIVPASVNFDRPAEGCRGLYIPREATPRPLRHVLVEAFGHAGQSAALVLRRAEGGPTP